EALTASERRARQLTEASLDGIVVADDEGRIILFNPAAERTFGYPAAEVLGEPLTCLMPAEFHERHGAGVGRFVENREARLVGRTVQVAGRRKDGTQFPLELALGALEVGGRVQFIGTIRDVTERDHMRAAMIQSEKLASIGLLTAGVAHEINNPLAYVANNLTVGERDTHGVMAVLDAYEGARELLAAADPATAARVRKLATELDPRDGRRADASASRAGPRARRFSSRWPTTAAASRRRTCLTCSIPSSRPRRSATGPGSAYRSPMASWRGMAGDSRCRASPARGAAS